MNTLILATLKRLVVFLSAKVEMGGLLDSQGRIVRIFKGTPSQAKDGLTLEARRQMGEKGLMGFHTHLPKGASKPSSSDLMTAYIRGTPEYIICHEGTVEIKPTGKYELKELFALQEQTYDDSRTSRGFNEVLYGKLLAERLAPQITLYQFGH